MKSKKIKLFVFILVEALAIATIFLLILFAGRKTYTITFDLNGGELISGSKTQEVRRGGTATPPNVMREGCYLLKWNGQYNKVTGDTTVYAVWEYETTAGIEYEVLENSNYCVISGCFDDLSGDVYLGAYFGDLKVLGIKAEAFKDCKYITGIFMIDGIISIGDNAFEGCEKLAKLMLPKTVERIGANAFAGCSALEEVVLPEKLEEIKGGAFSGCTALTEVIIPQSVEIMGYHVFDEPGLIVNIYIKQEDVPTSWNPNWAVDMSQVVYEYVEETDEDEDKDKEKGR